MQFQCSACGKKVRAPDEAAGRKCRCPHCQAVISVPAVVVEAEEVEQPIVLEEEVPPPDEEKRRPCPMCGESILADAVKCRYCGEIFDEDLERVERKKKKKKRRPTAPGIALIVLGTIGLLAMILSIISQPNGPPQGGPFGGPKPGQAGAYMFGMRAAQICFPLIDVLIIAGGVSMVTASNYRLAKTASVLAMLNLGALCCIPGIPVGIWSLMVLNRPEVQRAFDS
jgi:predicted RNA-binding Zn-ribbon protein involved in translation (DUF1610 family)